ncbi:protein of unknown function [Mesotoga infera]|uniref:Uncharacterized protein n=1 Tax=Mesotoga infera TaxID=1236046 RepID=A0A7Z7LE63_9BACT|nr:protein of unknown function [Mesotoga infera]
MGGAGQKTTSSSSILIGFDDSIFLTLYGNPGMKGRTSGSYLFFFNFI